MKILEYLREKNINNVPSPCGGRGTCGKCRVMVVNDGSGEKKQVLACQTDYEDGMTIIVPDQHEENMEIAASAADALDTGNAMGENRSGGMTGLAAACDIGTTTVVCHLVDRKSGRVIATTAYPNAQRSYGADVISRIEAARTGRLAEMRDAIVSQVQQMMDECLIQSGREKERISQLVVAGNTVMCHIFAGISPESIGRAPFKPQEYFGKGYSGRETGFGNVDTIYIMPAVSGYVGGDISSDMLYIDTHKGTKETMLLLDIGTNGEMVLGSNGDYISCATAAGPAFEGAEIELGMSAVTGAVSKVWIENDEIQIHVIGSGNGKTAAKGICGSGLIDALYVFLQLGLIDQTGRIKSHREISYRYHRYLGDDEEENDCIFLTDDVYITQDDIRKLQLAKGAVAAGIMVLMRSRKLSWDDIGAVFIAGGFGSVLNKYSAAGIGMIPVELVDKTQAVGNAAAEGAVITAASEDAEKRLKEIQAGIKYIELSSDEYFSDEYIRQMNLGEMKWKD